MTIGVMPKSTRNPYFEECRRGAEQAAGELGFNLRWSGPPEPNSARQAQIAQDWMQERLPVVAVSVESREQLSPILKSARSLGIKILTWDADADADARDFTIVQATAESIGQALSFEVGRLVGRTGTLAAITASLSAANQNAWIAEFKARLARDYSGLRLVDVRPCEDDQENARRQAQALLDAHPGLDALVGFCSPAVPGIAEAVKQTRRGKVRITGVSLPLLCRSYIEEGVVDSIVTWNPRNLGYLAAAAGHALAAGTLQRGAFSLRAGHLGNVMVFDDQVRLGRCNIVSKGNLEKFAG